LGKIILEDICYLCYNKGKEDVLYCYGKEVIKYKHRFIMNDFFNILTKNNNDCRAEVDPFLDYIDVF
jgi:hypothetical protein